VVDLNIAVLHKDNIRYHPFYSQFSFLQRIYVSDKDSIQWNWKDSGKILYLIQVMFIGKTGYGKSTTLNKICNADLFESDDISGCTRRLQTAMYRLKKKFPLYLSFCDFPGIGESANLDKQYIEWYSEMLGKSRCIVYLLRADQRDFSIDLQILKEMGVLSNQDMLKKTIFAINFADKIEPLNRAYPFNPDSKQLKNLNKKTIEVRNIFGVNENNILYYSAAENYNIDDFINKITMVLKNEVLKNENNKY